MRLKLLVTTAAVALTLTACPPPDNTTVSTTTSDVTVTKTVAADQSAPCIQRSGLTRQVSSTSSAFVLTINASAPLCSPVDAQAVIYAMPTDGTAWPQQLVTAEPFRISEAGTVTVTFTKGCGAVQFDVLTGAAPQTITSGLGHGPLLFPNDLSTSQQWFGAACTDDSTTTAAPTTAAPTTSAPTTTEATTTTTEATTTTTEPPTTTSTTTTTEPPTTTTTSTTVPPTTTTTTTEPPTTTTTTSTTVPPTTTTTTTIPPTTTTTTTTIPPTTTTTSTTTIAPTTTTTSTTTTTVPPLLSFEITGQADKSAGCFSGAAGDDTFHVPLGSDGVWDFYFQGCSAFATETVALDDPPGGPFADAFQSPTGYQCKMTIDGTSDGIGYHTNQLGGTPDTGGLIFIQSASTFTSNWPNTTTWRITCDPL